MRAASLLAFSLSLGLFAGCVQPRLPGETEPGPATPVLLDIPDDVIEFDHDHSLPELHQVEYNMELVAYHSSYGDGNVTELPQGQGFSEIFIRDGLVFLGRRVGDDGGFAIFDVKDPAHPKVLGAYAGLANYDMESAYDNRYVFFVSQWLNRQQNSSVPPDDPGEAPRLIHVIDISNPAMPEEVSAFPVPTRGVHTITYHRTEGGRELVTAQTYDFIPDPSLGLTGVPDQGSNPVSQRMLIYDFVREPHPALRLLSEFQRVEPMTPTAGIRPHDTTIQLHPVTKQLIAYVAYWDLGAILVDITDPANPVEISRLTDFSPSRIRALHLASPADTLIGGIHLTVTEPELGGGENETGQYTFFDTTDPTKPKRLGYWRLPGNLGNDVGLRFSPHNFEVEGGRLYLAHYHAGVWILDVSTPDLLGAPRPLAMALPHQPRTGAFPVGETDTPMVWSAYHDDGYVYASDMLSGLYVYRYLGPAPA